MSTADDPFPRTVIAPSATQHSSARRLIEIRHLADKNVARGETYANDMLACSIESRQQDAQPFSPPRVAFGCNGAQRSTFTRAEWERLKREVDQAFDGPSSAPPWPLDREGDSEWVDAGGGVEIKP